jgi:hypothetical protein
MARTLNPEEMLKHQRSYMDIDAANEPEDIL